MVRRDRERSAEWSAGSLAVAATFHKATCMISVKFFPYFPQWSDS